MMTIRMRLQAPFAFLTALFSFLYGCGSGEQPVAGSLPATVEDTIAAEADLQPGWINLFDGSGMDQWKGFGQDSLPAGWLVDHGMMVLRAPDTDQTGSRGDLITRDTFGNFELELEVMLTDSANSGIFIRVPDDPSHVLWQWAPEFQLIDDPIYDHWLGEEHMFKHHTGDCYDLYAAEPGLASTTGVWNAVRILALGSQVQYWLNGRVAVSFDMASPDWQQRVAKSKFSPFPQFAKAKSGHIGLQDHDHAVRFRNIRIRRISE
ncbi:MAG: DUF1080 domain-containing protein [Saprospiraceae bacterium]|nr:DUF1080 domain-containing protein [Saprospiraceae bacterium]